MNGKITRIVLVILAMAVLALLITSSMPQTKINAVFADGFKVTLEKVTYGRRHEFHQGSKLYYNLKQNWPRFLPSLPSVRYGEHSFSSDIDTIVPWISLQDASGNYVSPQMEISVEDEHGCVFSNNGGSSCTVGKMQIDCTKLEAYPRRQKQFKMRFTRGTNVVTFMVRNPKIIHPVEWTPSPLPVTAKLGDITTTIVELNAGKSRDGSSYFSPKWEISDKGHATTEWSFYSMRYLDATGNSGYVFLCPHEPAVKLCLDLRKNADATFGPNELWALPATPLPGPGEFVPLKGSRMFDGATIRLESLAGPGIVTYSNGVPISSEVLEAALSGRGLSSSSTSMGGNTIIKSKADASVFVTTITGMKTDQNILIFCVDDKGRKTVADGGYRRMARS